MIEDKINLEDFKKWLESKEDSDIVGETGDSKTCPLATYINTLGPYPNALVGITSHQYYTYGEDLSKGPIHRHVFLNCAWMIDFIEEADMFAGKMCALQARGIVENLKG